MRLGHGKRQEWITRVVLLLSALTMLVWASGCTSIQEHLAMKDAAKAYKAGNYKQAAEAFQRALYL
ncbi:MAG: hypothetical protein P8Z49_07280, partial [Acidobacteriota bacterium]